MLVAIIAGLVGLAAVLAALAGDRPSRAVTVPVWGQRPTVREVARPVLPRRWPGYDPAAVESHLESVAAAYGDLLVELERTRGRQPARAPARSALAGGYGAREELRRVVALEWVARRGDGRPQTRDDPAG